MSSKLIKVQYIIWILTFPFSSSAQTDPGTSSQQVSIKDALAFAVQNYPSIKAKSYEKESALYDLKAATNNYLPNFIVQGQVLNATSNQVRGTFFPNEGTAIPVAGGIKVNGYTNDAVWTSFATALINWNIFNFGKYKAAVNSAKSGILSAEADYRNEVFRQQVKVSDAYMLGVMLQKMMKTQDANLKRVKALRDVTIALTKSGLRPGVDSSLVNAEYSRAFLQLLEAKRIYDEQIVYLKELMGITDNTNIVLDTLVFMNKSPLPIPEQKNFSNNPSLVYYKSIVDFEQSKIKAARKKGMPSVSLLAAGWGRGSGITDRTTDNGNFIYNKSFSGGVPFRAYNYMIGVSTIWNITSLFKTGNEARAQQSMAKMSEERYNEEYLKVQREIERAELRYEAAVEASKQAPIQLTAANDAYLQAKARYDTGLNNIIELTQTFAVLNRAEVDAANAKINVWRAVLAYAAADGNFELFTNNLN